MSVILSITFRLLIASLAITTISACRSTDRPAELVAITCPPGMTPAAKQGICLQGSCGNGLVDADEACDDGNVIAGDGCSPDCRSTESCGNGTVDQAVGEICDDGNTTPHDRCCSDCRSCPELAMLHLDEAQAPANVDVATEHEPCAPEQPTPEVTRGVTSQDLHDSPVASRPRPHARAVIHATRPAAPAKGRLADQNHARMHEELAQARSTLAGFEQINAELRRSLEDARRELVETQRRLVRGIALQ